MPDKSAKDERQELPKGSSLKIEEENTGNSYEVTIRDCIGRGGSCLVYRGIMRRFMEGKERSVNVIIKELYPVSLGIRRASGNPPDTALEIPDEKSRLFNIYKEDFAAGQAELSSYYDSFKDQTLPRCFLYGHSGSTVYAVSDPGKGRLLSGIPTDTLTPERAALIMEYICKAIKKLHTNEKLYLDCKPDNFYYFFEENIPGANVFLFDFDTVTKLSDLKYGTNKTCPFSPGWAAPEQIPSPFDARYKDTSLIGYHTDIFAVGEVFFWLLTGRKPEAHDLEEIKEDRFDWDAHSKLFRGLSTEAKTHITGLEKDMLEPDPHKRREAFNYHIAINDIEKRFARLYGLTAGGDEHFAPIHESLENLKSDINKSLEKKNSAGSFLFGTKKRIAATLCCLAAAAVVAGFLATLGARTAGRILPEQMQVKEQILEDHVIFELSEADHDYETGMENWKRLDYNRALRDITAAKERVSGLVSSDGADAARINNSLGCLYLDMGRYGDAYDRLNDALVAFKSLYGDNSSEVLAARFSVAQYDRLSGDTDRALKSLQQITDMEDIGKNKALAAAVLNLQAEIYDELGEYDRAISVYEELLGLYDDILSDGGLTKEFSKLINDPELTDSKREEYIASLENVLLAYANMAQAYIHAEKYEEAESLLTEAIDIAEENVYIGKKNLITSKLYMTLAQDYEKTLFTSKGLEAIDLAERIQKNLFDYKAVYPGLVKVYDIYADLLMQDGNVASAYQYYSDAVRLARESFGENHPETAEALYSFGMSYLRRELPNPAIEYFEEAIEIRKNILAYENVTTKRYIKALEEAKSLSSGV